MDPTVLITWLAIQSGVGLLIGRARGRPLLGWILGLLLGPIGWITMAVLSDKRPKCPECLGVVVPGAKKCKSCGSTLPIAYVFPRLRHQRRFTSVLLQSP